MASRPSLTRFAWLSITAAVVTIALKAAAYMLTGSVGLLSDALESLVNLFGAVVNLVILSIAARPPDEEHGYGHDKAEYFASGMIGALILLAAASIAFTAIPRLITPQPIEQLNIGLALSILATVVNVAVALVLLQAGRRSRSIALEADGHHLLTDVWTSVGVLVGIGIVQVTGLQRIDPIIALLVAANIVWSGVQIIRRSALGLLDTALPVEERNMIGEVLERYAQEGVQYHALRTRQSGARRFVSLHVLVPGTWTVLQGHELLEQIERDVRIALPNTNVFTHLEPLEDPISWEDVTLDRPDGKPLRAHTTKSRHVPH